MPLWPSTSITTEPAVPAKGIGEDYGARGGGCGLVAHFKSLYTYSFSSIYGCDMFSLFITIFSTHCSFLRQCVTHLRCATTRFVTSTHPIASI